jgi:hypothetical protein
MPWARTPAESENDSSSVARQSKCGFAPVQCGAFAKQYYRDLGNNKG